MGPDGFQCDTGATSREVRRGARAGEGREGKIETEREQVERTREVTGRVPMMACAPLSASRLDVRARLTRARDCPVSIVSSYLRTMRLFGDFRNSSGVDKLRRVTML